ncbi:MAG: SUMF1/EgtB/PvdO family nonheme iron enzyme, partial [Candidatus Poribacteria bacterium]
DPSWCHMKDSHRGRMLPACIGQYPVDESVYGVRDMAGNMRDWTGTAHPDDSHVHDGEAVSSQQGAGEGGANRVFRGGNWHDNPRDAQLSVRFRTLPHNRVNYLGLRLARSIP